MDNVDSLLDLCRYRFWLVRSPRHPLTATFDSSIPIKNQPRNSPINIQEGGGKGRRGRGRKRTNTNNSAKRKKKKKKRKEEESNEKENWRRCIYLHLLIIIRCLAGNSAMWLMILPSGNLLPQPKDHDGRKIHSSSLLLFLSFFSFLLALSWVRNWLWVVNFPSAKRPFAPIRRNYGDNWWMRRCGGDGEEIIATGGWALALDSKQMNVEPFESLLTYQPGSSGSIKFLSNWYEVNGAVIMIFFFWFSLLFSFFFSICLIFLSLKVFSISWWILSGFDWKANCCEEEAVVVDFDWFHRPWEMLPGFSELLWDSFGVCWVDSEPRGRGKIPAVSSLWFLSDSRGRLLRQVWRIFSCSAESNRRKWAATSVGPNLMNKSIKA